MRRTSTFYALLFLSSFLLGFFKAYSPSTNEQVESPGTLTFFESISASSDKKPWNLNLATFLLFKPLQPAPLLDPPSSESEATPYWQKVMWDIRDTKSLFSEEDCQNLELKTFRVKMACAAAWWSTEQLCRGHNVPSSQKQWPWNQLLNDSQSSFSFAQTIARCPLTLKPAARAQWINTFLSFSQDPHTYLIPFEYFQKLMEAKDYSSSSLWLRKTLDEKTRITHWDPFYLKSSRPLQLGWQVTHIGPWQTQYLTQKQIQKLIESQKSWELEIFDSSQSPSFFHVTIEQNLNRPPVYLSTLTEHTFILRLDKFFFKSCEQVMALLRPQLGNLQGLILDLRENPGGSVEEARCLLDLFTEKGTFLFATQDRQGRWMESYYSQRTPLYRGPLAVLINTHSASASEIVAGSLKSLGRAKIVGTKSFGKGSFQDGSLWGQNGQVIFFQTQGYFVFGNGQGAQLSGVEPDLARTCTYCKELLSEENLYIYPLPSLSHQMSVSSALSAAFHPWEKPKISKENDNQTCTTPSILSADSFSGDENLQLAFRLVSCMSPSHSTGSSRWLISE
jgi:C-terminal peptidase prc